MIHAHSFLSLDETIHKSIKLPKPKALFPLSREHGSTETIYGEITTNDVKLGYNFFWTPAGTLGSPIFDSYMNHHSYISMELKNQIKPSTELTIMLWIKPSSNNQESIIFVRAS